MFAVVHHRITASRFLFMRLMNWFFFKMQSIVLTLFPSFFFSFSFFEFALFPSTFFRSFLSTWDWQISKPTSLSHQILWYTLPDICVLLHTPNGGSINFHQSLIYIFPLHIISIFPPISWSYLLFSLCFILNSSFSRLFSICFGSGTNSTAW